MSIALLWQLLLCPLLTAQEHFAIHNIPLPGNSDTNAVLSQIRYGRQLTDMKKEDSAELVLYIALEKSKSQSFATGVRRALTTLANVYINREKYDAAIRLYRQTIAYCYSSPALLTALPALHNNLANVYLKKGNFELALHYYQQAVALYDTVSQEHYGEIFNNLGGLLIQLNRYDQVRYYLQKAEQIALVHKEFTLLPNIYGNMGSYYYEKGQPDSSLFFSYKALGLARQHRLLQAQYNILINIGEIYRRSGQYEKAIQHVKEALALEGNLLPYYRVHAFSVLGESYLETGNFQQSLAYLEKALGTAQKSGLSQRLVKLYLQRSRAYEGLGQYAKSLELYKLARTTEDSVSKESIKKNVLEWDLKYRTAEKDKSILQKQLEINKQKEELKSRNMWIAIISASLLLLISLFVILYAVYKINRHKLKRQEEQLHFLQQQQEMEQLKAIMTGEEKERKRLSHELHDGIGGMLAAVHMNLSGLEEKMIDGKEKNQVHKVLDMLQETSNEVRKTAHNLMPDSLVRHSLEEALLIYCEQINLGNRLYVQFQYHAQILLPKSIELLLYRISQELLQNIQKHAQAGVAWLMIKELKQKLSIIVEDNGSGFEPEHTAMGFGLQNLEYRVKSLQGNLNIQSAPGRGTTIHIEFDIDTLNAKSAL